MMHVERDVERREHDEREEHGCVSSDFHHAMRPTKRMKPATSRKLAT